MSAAGHNASRASSGAKGHDGASGGGRVFIFAGGGTGGHIYPALAIAEKLIEIDPSVRIRVLCSTRDVDARILKDETLAGRAVEFTPIDARPFGASPRVLWRLMTGWGASVRASREAIRAEAAHGTVHVVAMGGFVAAPAAQAARAERVPLTLVNLDATPGKANRWIAKRADRVFTASKIDEAHGGVASGWTLVPPIVRKAALAPGDTGECRRRLALDPSRPTLLVTGASLGAKSINLGVTRYAAEADTPLKREGWQIVHQTGKDGVDEVRDAYKAAGIRARVEPHFKEMGLAWGAADCAVSRAGAGSVAEAWANRVPTLFMPYPYHKDQHQRVNARPLVDAGGAMMIDDAIEPDANARALGVALPHLMERETIAAMRGALEKLGMCDGAERVGRGLIS